MFVIRYFDNSYYIVISYITNTIIYRYDATCEHRR